MKKRVRVLIDDKVSVVLSDKGTCKGCGEVIVYAPMAAMWLHADRVRGAKHYDHEARPRR